MSSQFYIRRLLNCLFILGALVIRGWAQTETGQITGKVTDQAAPRSLERPSRLNRPPRSASAELRPIARAFMCCRTSSRAPMK